MISIASLIAAGVAPTQARVFAEPLLLACQHFDIDSAVRQGAFVAQCMVESANFVHLEEDLFYRSADRIRAIFPTHVTSLQQASLLVGKPEALANAVYAGRNGNGNPLTGDGWKYRGRGVIQLTGRTNYTDAGVELARPYVDEPDMLLEPEEACLTAAWFFSKARGNMLADAGLIDSITRAINGPALEQGALRKQRTEECTRAFA